MIRILLTLLLIATVPMAKAIDTAFAPTTLVGRSAVVIIGSGSGAFASSGGYRITFAESGLTYRITRITGSVLNTIGTYTYARIIGNPNGAVLNAVDSYSGGLRLSLSFSSTSEGTFQAAATVSGQGSQSGAVLLESGSVIAPPVEPPGGLLNMSFRAIVPPGGQVIPAFVLDATTTVLIRVSGPGLAGFGVPGTLPDPMLRVLSGSATIAINDDWSTSAASITDAATRSGAFPFTLGSKDAAVLLTLNPGNYTCLATEATALGNGGEVLVEVYRVP